MKSIKLSQLLKLEIKPFLLGALLSRILEEEIDGIHYFYAYTRFKSSKYIYQDDFDFKNYSNKYINKLNHKSGYYNWSLHKVTKTQMECRFYIADDLNITKNNLYKKIYQNTLTTSWVLDENNNNSKKDFIRGFMELRGSVDTTAKLISQDYFYDNKIELKKAQILTDLMNLPVKYANFNARNLQPQFVNNIQKRNAQFRINIYYFASEIGFLNDYKALVFEKAYNPIAKYEKDNTIFYKVNMPDTKNDDLTFIKYLNFFTNNIYQKQLTREVISLYRKQLNFDNNQPSASNRNRSLINLFNQITEDKCAICGTTHTFLNKTTNRQHFEIHHVISFCNDSRVDNIANLVKLCPTCHDMLKKNKSPKEIQIKAILKILHEHDEIFEFTSSYLGIDDINDLSEKIWSMLG